MSEHIERMKKEYNELADRVGKLGEFIYANEVYDTLPRDERVRMAQQYGLMRSYMNVLNERLLAAHNKQPKCKQCNDDHSRCYCLAA